MIPLRDTIPSRTFPFMNYAIILVNVLVFIYELLLHDTQLENFFFIYGLVPDHIVTGLASHKISLAIVLPFITCMFLHGGWLHIIGNMWFLYIFGDNVEDRLGHVKYLFFYVACGVGAGISQFLASWGSRAPMIGASGAIAGVLGAYFLLYPHARILTLLPIFIFIQIIELPAFIFLLFWMLIQFVYGTISIGALSKSGGGTAWWAHIGGFLLGMLIIKLTVKRKRPPVVHYPTKWEIN
jgi:rhomboid family protein